MKTDVNCCKKNSSQKLTPYPYLGNSLSDEEKIVTIEHHFSEILKTLGLDLSDDSLKRTPHRYAKMVVNELFQGLNDESFPQITTQENKFNYDHALTESHISIQTVCEHHFIPIIGYCHISYIPKKEIIGLSKLSRIAQHYARRPQVQERLTKQISTALSEILGTPDVAVVIDALHLCVRMRGIQDQDALTRTIDLSGEFLKDPLRGEFFNSIPKLSDLKI